MLASARRAAADVVNAQLLALNGERIMIDGLVVPFLGFGSTPQRAELPAGRLEVQTGDTVNLTITNGTTRQVGLAVPGVAGARAPVAAGVDPHHHVHRAGTARHVLLRRHDRREHRHRPGAGDDRGPRRPAAGATGAPSTPYFPGACARLHAASRCSAPAGATIPADVRAGAHLAVRRTQPRHRAGPRRGPGRAAQRPRAGVLPDQRDQWDVGRGGPGHVPRGQGGRAGPSRGTPRWCA